MPKKSPCPKPEWLDALKEGRLPPKLTEAVKRHLAECSQCAERLTELAAIVDEGECAPGRPTGATPSVVAVGAEMAAAETSPHLHPPMDPADEITKAMPPAGTDPTGPAISPSSSEPRALSAPPRDPTTHRPPQPRLRPPEGPGELGRLGRYRVRKLLGYGGMGMVYQAEDLQLRRVVALKVMRADIVDQPGARERFLREARAAAALQHDHIIAILEVGEDFGVPFLAMPFLKGASLEQWMRKNPKPTPREIARLGRQIARGLAAAHANGLIHRDIKPGNIWLEAPRGRVKILDFGLARAVSEDLHLTQSGQTVGTPAYMAPEQARGKTLDGRADLYSLGCILYRMATGGLPIEGENLFALLTALAVEQPVPVATVNPGLPARLAQLIDQLLSKQPSLRPSSAHEVAQQLAAIERDLIENRNAARSDAGVDERADDLDFLKGLATTAIPTLSPLTTPRPLTAPSSWRRFSLTLLIAALVAAATGIWYVRNSDGTLVLQSETAAVVAVEHQGRIVGALDSARHPALSLPPGRYALHLDAPLDRYEVEPAQIDLRRGGRSVVQVRRRTDPARPSTTPAARVPASREQESFEAWVVRVQTLTGTAPIAEVEAKLRERNPQWNGTMQAFVKDGVVHQVNLSGAPLSDLAPLRALPGLRVLVAANVGLDHLKDVRTLPVVTLNLDHNPVSDLAPLEGMPLRVLHLHGTRVRDLWPLRKVPLQGLVCRATLVDDLTPILGCPLESLFVDYRVERDGRLLRRLASLTSVNEEPAADLWARLQEHERAFALWRQGVASMAPAQQIEAVTLELKRRNPTFDGVLQAHRDGNAIVHLRLSTKDILDIEPLAALTELHTLDLSCAEGERGRLSDLSPLARMKLTSLNLARTQVFDLRPLQGLRLRALHLEATRVEDFAPLAGLPLEVLSLDLESGRVIEVLRKIRTLRIINGKSLEEFGTP